MASEEGTTPERTIVDRVAAIFERLHAAYESLDGTARNYTPYLVRTIEVILAVALFVLLTRWIYLFYTAG